MQLLFPKPLLTTSSAHLISLGLGAVYVGSIYLSKNARLRFTSRTRLKRTPHGDDNGGNGNDHANELRERERQKNERWRDDPDVIRARLVAVSIATVVCILCVLAVLWSNVGGTLQTLDIVLEATLLRLGFPSLNPFAFHFNARTLLPHLVTPMLFLGPIFTGYLGGELPGQRNWMWRTHIVARFFRIQGLRNYWIAPITEEIVFRACVLAIYHLSGASRTKMIFLAPLTFGLAHVHHCWETYNRYGRTIAAAKYAAIATLLQLSYTTLFGFLVSYLFLRTGSILVPITAHMWCNVMGLPEIGYELKRFRKYRIAIITTYLTGIAAFTYLLGRWTETEGNFYWPSEGAEAVYGKY
ncbi:hypothetical protein M413DRAFT_449099 [Hebeloma cylindrosporum]|uniref:intramembrane prenyl-peptidase Rce1 n=1 Tax=Hebeloma cylindrosporum TaxID=76867 RepID=A0A0C2XF42_HEBCY|nr:hypothetical protein M413DRAFT_449099 [Hebeloma cylindrosporum h7]